MSNIFTRRLGALFNFPSSTWTPMYTVPPGAEVILRDLVVTNFGATAGAIQVAIVNGSNYYFVAFGDPWPAKTGQRFDLRQQLLPGDSLEAFSTVGNITSVLATGYVFS